MKAKISSFRESDAHKDSTSHIVSVFFVNPDTTLGLATDTQAFVNASIASGVNEYRMTIDLIRLYGTNEVCKTNGIYDPSKGLALFQQTFPIGKEMDGISLYDVTINELRPDLQYVIRADNNQPFASYRRAFVGDRVKCIEMLKSDLARSIGRGDFIEPKENQPQNANPLASLANAQTVGEGN